MNCPTPTFVRDRLQAESLTGQYRRCTICDEQICVHRAAVVAKDNSKNVRRNAPRCKSSTDCPNVSSKSMFGRIPRAGRVIRLNQAVIWPSWAQFGPKLARFGQTQPELDQNRWPDLVELGGQCEQVASEVVRGVMFTCVGAMYLCFGERYPTSGPDRSRGIREVRPMQRGARGATTASGTRDPLSLEPGRGIPDARVGMHAAGSVAVCPTGPSGGEYTGEHWSSTCSRHPPQAGGACDPHILCKLAEGRT